MAMFLANNIPPQTILPSQQEDEVLDLCIKKPSPAPSPINNNHHINNNNNNFVTSSYNYIPPIGQYSPVSNSDSDTYDGLPSSNSKPKTPRPFKAYPSDPLTTLSTAVNLEIPIVENINEGFAQFRQSILAKIQTNNGTNKNMRRTSTSSQQKIDDPAYWEKRRKNNEAAKRSRDARRAKEDEIAIRCIYLEKENLQLKIKLATLESEKKKLQELFYRHCNQ